MDPKTQASTTALMVAGFRALASRAPDAIINDPWADAIVGDDLHRVTKGFLQAFPAMTLWIAVRTAFLDHTLQRFTSAPFHRKQIVVLGAGFDTRAARLSSPDTRFFEVDAPASQEAKLRKLDQLDKYPRDAATYVTCDFEREHFMDRLAGVGFDKDAPALFLWEGVSYYLTESAVQNTLQTIASSHPSSIVAFDFVGKAFVERSVSEDQQASLDVLEGMGEPMQWGCNDIIPILYKAGYRAIQTTRFDEACLAFTGTYERDRMFRFQSLAVASPDHALGLSLLG